MGHVVVVHGHVHLPSGVIGEIVPIRRVAHGKLVEPSMGEADGDRRCHDLERGMLGLVVEQPGLASSGGDRARHVLHTLLHVGGGGVTEDPFAHALRRGQPATACLSVLKLLPLPVLLEAKASALAGKIDGGDRHTRGDNNSARLEKHFSPVYEHAEGAVCEAGAHFGGAGARKTVRVGDLDDDAVVEPFRVGGHDGEASDVRDLRQGRDGRGHPHVEVHRRQVRDQAVPLAVIAGKVERLATEPGHVWIACGEGRHGRDERFPVGRHGGNGSKIMRATLLCDPAKGCLT